MLRLAQGVGFAAAILMSTSVFAQQVEVMHWWTSPGESAAVNVMKQQLEKKGIKWLDAPIAGGGGQAAMTALRARVVAGNPPTAAMVLGYDIKDWAELKLLGDISEGAQKDGWDANYPAPYKFFGMYDNKWVATPFDVHSTNWLWINRADFDKLGVSEPTDWASFITMLQAAKDKGIIPLAHGGQGWQDAILLGNVVMATGGIDFYRKTILQQDKAALGSDTMKTVLQRVLQLKGFMDPNSPGRDWNLASAMVIKGDALTQTMGDWAKGEFTAAGKKPGDDYMCVRFPGTQGIVSFVADSFVFFNVADDKKAAQLEFARTLMTPEFQEPWSVLKGSVPSNLNASDKLLDACGKKAFAEYKAAATSGNLVGAIQLFSAPAAIRSAVEDVVSRLLSGDLDVDGALAGMVASADAAK